MPIPTLSRKLERWRTPITAPLSLSPAWRSGVSSTGAPSNRAARACASSRRPRAIRNEGLSRSAATISTITSSVATPNATNAVCQPYPATIPGATQPTMLPPAGVPTDSVVTATARHRPAPADHVAEPAAAPRAEPEAHQGRAHRHPEGGLVDSKIGDDLRRDNAEQLRVDPVARHNQHADRKDHDLERAQRHALHCFGEGNRHGWFSRRPIFAGAIPGWHAQAGKEMRQFRRPRITACDERLRRKDAPKTTKPSFPAYCVKIFVFCCCFCFL